MKKKIKNIFTYIMFASFMLLASKPNVAYSADKIYEMVDSKDVVKGITYDNKYSLTTDGWLDLHILTIDLSNENVLVKPISSASQLGLRQHVKDLVSDNGAIAGVNASYFGLTATYTTPLGIQIADGEVMSVNNNSGEIGDTFGTFFEDENGDRFFEYFKTNITLNVEDVEIFEFAGINIATKMDYPVYIDRNGMTDTSDIDRRFSNITKFVVEDNIITKVSEPGEVVSIPENGYVIALNDRYTEVYQSYLTLYKEVSVDVVTSFDVEKIEMAVSGGGVLLKNGEMPSYYGEMATGRHPRTLIGLSEDKNTLKLIVAEGLRTGGNTTSIGLTPVEAFWVLKEEGMYYGLNLDGGGSSIMAIKDADSGVVLNVSDPAESVARLIPNAVGVFDNSKVTEAKTLVVVPSTENAAVGAPFSLDIHGLDENLHKINIPKEDITFHYEKGNMSMVDGDFVPKTTGNILMLIEYKSIVHNFTINVEEIFSIMPNQKTVSIMPDESVYIDAYGVTQSGSVVDIPSYELEFETTIGNISNGKLTVLEAGVGYVKVKYKNLETYVKVNAGTDISLVSSFENGFDVNFTSVPAKSSADKEDDLEEDAITDITGEAFITAENYSEGGGSVKLNYTLPISDETQIAYANFDAPLEISGRSNVLYLDVLGNDNLDWLRAILIDGTGSQKVIEIAPQVNWLGWKELEISLPEDIVYPIKLKSIYAVSLKNDTEEMQTLYFDNLRAELPINYENFVLPKDIVSDKKESGMTFGKDDGYTYYNFTGNIVSNTRPSNSLYTSSRILVNEALAFNSDYSVYASNEDVSMYVDNGTLKINWQPIYNLTANSDITFITMSAKNGTLYNTDKFQWQRFINDGILTPTKTIVYMLDKAPSEFTDPKELELFKKALSDVSSNGKNVFVVSSNSLAYSSILEDGVNYITLPDLWQDDGYVNESFKIFRIKVSDDELYFEDLDVL